MTIGRAALLLIFTASCGGTPPPTDHPRPTHPGARFDLAALAALPEAPPAPHSAWIPYAPEITSGPILIGSVAVRGRWLIARREWSQREGDRVLLAPVVADAFGPTIGAVTLGSGETPLAILPAADDGAPWLVIQHPAPTHGILVERTDVRAIRVDGSDVVEGLATLPANDAARILHAEWRADPRPRGVVAWRGATYRPLTDDELAAHRAAEAQAMDPIPPPLHVEREWTAITVTRGASPPPSMALAGGAPPLLQARVAPLRTGALAFFAAATSDASVYGIPPSTRRLLWLDVVGREARRADDPFAGLNLLPESLVSAGDGAVLVARSSEPGRPQIDVTAFALGADGTLGAAAPIPAPAQLWNRGRATAVPCATGARVIVPATLADQTVHVYLHTLAADGTASLPADVWSRPLPRQYDLPSAFAETHLACTAGELAITFRHTDSSAAGIALVRQPL